MAENEYYSVGDLTLLLINEGFTRYAVSRAIDRLKIMLNLLLSGIPRMSGLSASNASRLSAFAATYRRVNNH